MTALATHVRVVMAEPDLARMFGPATADDPRRTSRREWRMLRESLKQSRRLGRRFRRNLDVQIQTEQEAARYAEHWRLRLDSCPDGFFDAGIGDA